MREKDCNFATNTVLRIYLRDVRVYRTFPVALTSEASVRLQVCDPTRAQGARLAGKQPGDSLLQSLPGTRRRKLHFESFTLEESFRERKGERTRLFLEKMELRKGRRKRKQRLGSRRGSLQGRGRTSNATRPPGGRGGGGDPRP